MKTNPSSHKHNMLGKLWAKKNSTKIHLLDYLVARLNFAKKHKPPGRAIA